VTDALKVVSRTLQCYGYSLHSIGYSPRGVKSSLHWELSEWWLLFFLTVYYHEIILHSVSTSTWPDPQVLVIYIIKINVSRIWHEYKLFGVHNLQWLSTIVCFINWAILVQSYVIVNFNLEHIPHCSLYPPFCVHGQNQLQRVEIHCVYILYYMLFVALHLHRKTNEL